MQDLNNKNTLLELLAQGATIITPNNRLSAALIQQYFKKCNNKTVEKPVCLPYNSAIIEAYQQFIVQTPDQSHPILLNNTQCQHLWRKIIKSDNRITYSEGLLNAVMEAWGHCQQWQIFPNNPLFHYTIQTRQFQKWWNDFNNELNQKCLLSEHQIIPYLMNTNHIPFSQVVVWVCFDVFNPQQISLQNYLGTKGIEQFHYDLEEQDTIPSVFSAKDTNEEYQQLMSWLQLRVQQNDERIGVVVPELQKESQTIQRVIQRHFAPELFNISLGQKLSTYPLIAHALAWLSLEQTQINHHQISLLLQSPYIGNAKEEFLNRSQYLQDSTLLQNQIIPFTALTHDLEHNSPKLAGLLKQIKAYPIKATPQEWIDLFQNRLNAIGFPGDYGLNSENYQCLNRFTSLFDELRQLNLITTQLSANEALDALKNLSDSAIFQPQKTNAPIHITGLLEASGCEFDSLWVMGLTDQCLPQKTRLSAFIPPQLQRELLMPHSAPERELHFAKQTIQRLRRGAPYTIFSFPRLQGDNPNLPCTLISEFPAFEALSSSESPVEQCELIIMDDPYSLPIKPEEHISGGTSLLANQAKCPFKALAEHRLAAKPLLQTSDGLDSKERGQIIHKVMELFWLSLRSQEELLSLSPKNLDDRINQAITTALTPLKQLHPDSFPNLLKEVEHTRLKRLVLSCLEWEKQRPPFEIASLEESYSIELAGLNFKVRVDRLDQVEDNKWVIDYKSSLPGSKPWYEERPQEPQLLLYSLLDEHINALLLLQLKSGKIICSGLSEEKQPLSGMSSLKKEETWEQYRTNWREQLTHLAEEFQQGHCPPQPASLSICQRCDFQNLCRFQANT